MPPNHLHIELTGQGTPCASVHCGREHQMDSSHAIEPGPTCPPFANPSSSSRPHRRPIMPARHHHVRGGVHCSTRSRGWIFASRSHCSGYLITCVNLDRQFPVARGQIHFLRENNENRERTKAPHTPRKHQKQLFDIGFFGWLDSFPWAGGPPASDPDA